MLVNTIDENSRWKSIAKSIYRATVVSKATHYRMLVSRPQWKIQHTRVGARVPLCRIIECLFHVHKWVQAVGHHYRLNAASSYAGEMFFERVFFVIYLQNAPWD